MADDLHTNDRHSAESMSPVSDAPGEFARYDGAFFSGAQHFVVNGGHFTNSKIFNPPPDIPPDFRRIPQGDVDLRREIRLDRAGVVHPLLGTAARRMYSARIEGRQSDMTVAVYRGENMEESWQREIAKYHKIWHPNFVQLYGIVSSPRLYATIFHDELLPAGQYIEEDRRSMISVVYLYTFWSGELKDATAHFSTLVGSRALKIISFESSIWIRRSTARLCVELSKTSGSSRIYPFPWVDLALIPISLRSDQESAMVSSLTLAQYHHICYLYLRKSSWLETKHAEIRLHSIISLKEGKNQQIALIPNAMVRDLGWTRLSTIPGVQQSVVVVESGWTRFTLPSVEQARITLHLTVQPHIGSIPDLARWWLSQANHILRLYSNSVDYEEYSVVSSIQYQLTFLSTAEIDPEVYLFLCPLEDLISEDGDFIERPECPAYWSLDPSGCQRLGPKETSVHGLPTFEWKRRVLVNFWDEHVYAGLSQFHAEKGFDPNSQDIARHLEYPLYRLSCDPGPDHARSEEVSAEEPDLGPMNQAKITEHSQTDNEDSHYDKTHQDHQNKSVVDISKTHMDRRLAIRDVKFMILGVLGAVLALFSLYLFSL